MVKDTVVVLNESLRSGKKILIEGANATMLDLDFGKNPINVAICHLYNWVSINTFQRIFGTVQHRAIIKDNVVCQSSTLLLIECSFLFAPFSA